ncbi:MAG: hypothetical protein JXA51_07710 [Dehalococcoidales bacterium]|nr:hypothetical protein [Dehalococcoidales bacterium]
MPVSRRTGIANLPLHGGKDGIPYPVDRQTCDQSIELLPRGSTTCGWDKSHIQPPSITLQSS